MAPSLRGVAVHDQFAQSAAATRLALPPSTSSIVSGMAQPNDLEARVAALEDAVQALAGRLRASEQDAAAARVLAGGADRDVTEFRTEIRDFRDQNTRVLNAMREDLGDLRGKVDTGFTEIRGKLDAAAAGQQQIVGLLTRLLGDGNAPTP